MMLDISMDRLWMLFILVVLMSLASQAKAELVVDGTRVIYYGADREATIAVSNIGGEVVLAHSWITDDKNEESPDIPFVIIEPLIKIEPQRRHRIRILYSGAGLPSDRESMFFLNVMGVPTKSGRQNVLQFAVKQRLKMFFRPKGMKGSVSDAVASLQWKRLKDRVEVLNSSRFHVTLTDLSLLASEEKSLILDYLLLKPGEHQYIDLKAPFGTSGTKLEFTEINDVGLQVSHLIKFD
ncbi:chaperone protein EcpD [Pseudomonas chlororaphis]